MPTTAAATIVRIGRTLELLQRRLPLERRKLRAGDSVYQLGDKLHCLYVVNSGFFKIVNLSADGREQVVGLHFKGDWLGFDGIAERPLWLRCGRDGHRRGLGVRYDALLQACAGTRRC